jgi:hypothetical protein
MRLLIVILLTIFIISCVVVFNSPDAEVDYKQPIDAEIILDTDTIEVFIDSIK